MRGLWVQSRWRVAVLVVAVLAGAACSSSEEPVAEEPLIRRTFDESSEADTGATEEPTPEVETVDPASLEPLDTPAEPDPGPELSEVTGRDWDEVAQGLLDLRTAAYDRRDADLGLLYATEECGCYEVMKDNIDNLLAYGVRRSSDAPVTARDVDFLLEERGLVTLEVTVEVPRHEASSTSGDLVQVREAEELRQRWTLVSVGEGDDGPWRVAILRRLDEDST